MSKALSFRPHTGSALDALASSSLAQARGLTRRLHDVAQRYHLLLANEPHPVDAHLVRQMALELRKLNTELPVWEPGTLNLALGHLAGLRQLPPLSYGQMMALVEELEETLATQGLA